MSAKNYARKYISMKRQNLSKNGYFADVYINSNPKPNQKWSTWQK